MSDSLKSADIAAGSSSATLAQAKLPMPLWELVGMAAALLALNALAIDTMLPALDNIAAAYQLADQNQQQMVIFAYVFGFSAPQLLYGPVSDRYGRRGILRMALIGYVLTSFACMAASSFAILLMLRFTQGLFAAGVRVVGVSIIRDLVAGRAMAKIMSLVMTVFMIVPIIAPMLGQGIMSFASYQWTFGVLGLGGLIVLVWVQFRLPETLSPKRRRARSAGEMVGAYLDVLKVGETRGYMLASGIIFGSLFAFIGASEQIFTEVFDKEHTFVFWFAAVAALLAVANLTNSRVVERFGMRRISHGALILFILISLVNIAIIHFSGLSFGVFFALFAAAFACFGLIGSNFSAIAMEAQGENAGTASAAYGFSTTAIAGVLGWLVARQFDGSVTPILFGFATLGVISFVIVLITEKGRLFERKKRTGKHPFSRDK